MKLTTRLKALSVRARHLLGTALAFVLFGAMVACGGGGTTPITGVQSLRPLSADFTTRKAVNYSPFRSFNRETEVITKAMIKQDMDLLLAGGFNLIRLFDSSDMVANQTLEVIRDNELRGQLRHASGRRVGHRLAHGPDIGMTPVLRRVRGKVAIYNENLRAIPRRPDATVADMWALRELGDPRMWAPDRLHFSPIGHHTIARMVLDALNVENELEPLKPEPMPQRSSRQARVEDAVWAREHFVPWVLRRVRGRSSGNEVRPERPEF